MPATQRFKTWLRNKMRGALRLPALEDQVQQVACAIGNLSRAVQRLAAGQEAAAAGGRQPAQEIPDTAEILRTVADRLVFGGGDDGILTCWINDHKLNMPTAYLRMVHQQCSRPTPERPLNYYVESTHCQWLASRLAAGDTAVDVGTSAGIITAALSRTVGGQGKVYAFEPAKRAFAILNRNIDLNGLTNVIPENVAVSNVRGQTTFVEFRYDPKDVCTWRPEASSIQTGNEDGGANHDSYPVETTLLDDYFMHRKRPIKAIKIDVEGFEVFVLEGAREILARDRPFLCIDIHKNVQGPGDTDPPLRSILTAYGYRLERMNHVMTATPCEAVRKAG
jgi:FkbM family methyltransferase